jgi:hypothetical protein
MWLLALERGLAAVVAKQLLASRIDLVFGPIERAGALKPEQLAKLKAELTANLQKAEVEGAPYAEVLSVASRELAARWPDVREAFAGVGRAAFEAAQKASEAARAEVQRASAEATAKRNAIVVADKGEAAPANGEARPDKGAA